MHKLTITDKDINIVVDNIKEYIKYIEKLTNIIWKIIPDYNDYIISEYGNIISIRSKKILNPSLNKYNNYQVNLYKNNICKDFKIHRLVYSIFVDKKIKSKDKIYFKDENKNNIHYSNLSSKFILPKNLINSNPILYNSNDITNIPKPIEYKDLKKIVDKYKSDNITNFIKNLQKDTKLEWRIILDYKNYIISEYGDIINLESRDILKPYINKSGYYQIGLCKNSIRKTFKIHRLVYSTFIDKDIKEFDIHHRDENKINNHYSNLQKITKSNHIKGHHNLESEEYLNRYKKYYNSKYKENLSTEEIAKKYNVLEATINYGIQQYKIYLSNNEDMNKYNNLNTKEKKDFYSNVILKEDKRKYLRKAEQIYNKKNKEHLTYKELSKIYNISETGIIERCQDIKFYIFLLDRDFDKFKALSKKEKLKLRKKIVTIDKQNNNILDIGKQIEDLKLSGISNRDIANKLNLSINRIPDMYKKYKKLINDKEIKDELKSIKNNNK